MSKFSSTVARLLALAVLAALAAPAAAQPAYPSKTIRLITPFAPGGGTTLVARVISQKMTEDWGQQVIVDNRPGGNTIIGSEALVKSPPDGYTIMLHASTHATNPNLLPLPYDTIRDFAAITTVSVNEYMLVAHPSVPARTVKELIALAKSKPGQLDYATTGTASTQHLATELFAMLAGIKMNHIPFKGGAPVITNLIGGQVQLAFTGAYNAIPFIKVGRLRPIAISGDTRLSSLPQVPTFNESGLPGLDIRNWYGMFAPAATPKPVIDKLWGEISRIMAMPDVKQTLASQGADPYVTTPEQFVAIIKADIARYGKIIKAANIKLED
jgi:tripartite-type tricarboxylate transporter receptor subunit TctC